METSTVIRMLLQVYFIGGVFFAGAKWTLMQQEGIEGWELVKGTLATVFVYPYEILRSLKVEL